MGEVSRCIIRQVAGRRDGPTGGLVAYTVNVGELLHALGASEGGVDVHWRRVRLLHCGGLGLNLLRPVYLSD